MKIIYTKHFPVKGFKAINLFAILFVRTDCKHLISKRTINHEMIHTEQMKELGYILFYILYFIFWIMEIVLPPYNKAYRDICFEREARDNEDNFNYLISRKRYKWIRKNKNKK